MTISFTLSLEEYQRFIAHMSSRNLKEKQRTSTITAIMQIILAPMFLFLRALGNLSFVGYILSAILLLTGVYHLFFFQKLYPRALQKRAAQTYEKRGYQNTPFTLHINTEGVTHTSHEKDVKIRWQDVKTFDETDDAFYFIMAEMQGLILPKRACHEEEIVALRQIIDDVRPKKES